MRQYHISTVTHELLGSPVHTLILPDVGRLTVRGARELKGDYPYCQNCSLLRVFRIQYNKSDLKVKIND